MDNGRTNNNGKHLIEMCRNLNLFICIGRICNDYKKGKTTCHNKRLLDYFIASCKTYNPWFHKECRDTKRYYRKSKQRYKEDRNPVNCSFYPHEGKLYIKCLKKHIRKCKNETSNMLRNQHKNSLEELWKTQNNPNTIARTVPPVWKYSITFRKKHK